MAGLYDPASGLPAWLTDLRLELLAVGADVRGEAALGGELVRRRRVVGAVETQPLRRLLGRLGTLDRDRVERFG